MKVYVVSHVSPQRTKTILEKCKITKKQYKHIISIRGGIEGILEPDLSIFQVSTAKEKLTNLFCEYSEILQYTKVIT